MTERKIVFTTKELIEAYRPMLTEWSIDKAIKAKKIPVIFVGRKRFFCKDDVDKWLFGK